MSHLVKVKKTVNCVTPDDITKAVQTLLKCAGVCIANSADLFHLVSCADLKKLTPEESSTLIKAMELSRNNVLELARKSRKIFDNNPPVIIDTSTTTKIFRKTVDQLAHLYQKKLANIGLEVTIEEVSATIRGETPANIVSTIVDTWVEDEKKKGVEII